MDTSSSLLSELVALIKDLSVIPSTADRPQEILRALDYISDYFKDTGLIEKRYERNGSLSLVISTHDTLSPDIAFLGHIDVVPAPDHLFVPVQEGNILRGRGVCDMKDGIAVMMKILKEYAGKNFPRSLALMITSDEETGGYNGARYLIDEIGYRPGFAFIPDGGSAPEELVLKNKGILQLEICAQGKTAHGSRPWDGENAIEKLISACGAVRTMFAEKQVPDVWQDTINFSIISGGEAINQIPDTASCKMDIRYTENTDRNELIRRIKKEAGECEIVTLTCADSVCISKDSEVVKKYCESVKKITGKEMICIHGNGGNDGRFLTPYGIPILVSRPVSGNQHGPNEWLDVSSLPLFYAIYDATIQSLIS
ncbi:M20/M25/M40 family metallo-hydrolase [Candidatus Uhrbacteria bacterium]|nr:M20/M25/M40 family metallo-hydrolase [Candidatus Uhrbacteria bacterium]